MSTGKKKTEPAQQSKSGAYAKWIIKNIILLAIATYAIFKIIDIQPGYNWAYNSLLKGNMQVIKQYPKLSFDEKMTMKLRYDYAYLQMVRDQTPEDAVILFPIGTDFTQEKSPFTSQIAVIMYATRFLYPRKLVNRNEYGASPLSDKITHVAVVNGMGLDNIPYKVDSTTQHGVFPFHPNQLPK